MQTYQLSGCVSSKFKSFVNPGPVVSSVEGYVFGAAESLVNSFFVIILIPICNNFLFPIVGQYMPNMKKRIGLGIIVILLASVTMLLLELTVNQSQTTRMAWFILPIFLVSLAEVSTAIPCEYHTTSSSYLYLLEIIISHAKSHPLQSEGRGSGEIPLYESCNLPEILAEFNMQ